MIRFCLSPKSGCSMRHHCTDPLTHAVSSTTACLGYMYIAEVATNPECRSRLRKDPAFFFWIRGGSQKFVKNQTRTGVSCHFRQ